MSGDSQKVEKQSSSCKHKSGIIVFQCVCLYAICSAAGISGCAKTESQPVETKEFQVPEGYQMSSSLAARINSVYIYDTGKKQCALITEEIDQVHYTADSYLKHLSRVLKQNEIDSDQVYETDAVILCRKNTSKKMACYINAKLKCRDVSITFQNPSKDENAVREILHSYLNSVGEEDADYVCTDFLMNTEDEQEQQNTEDSGNKQTDTETEEDGIKAEDSDKNAVQDSRVDPMRKDKQESTGTEPEEEKETDKVKTADDFITVVDKTASHTDER